MPLDPFGLLDPSILIAPPDGTGPDDFLAALRETLAGQPILSALTGVFNRKAPRKQPYPFLLLNWLSETPDLTSGRVTYPAWTAVQFTVLDDDDVRGCGLRDAAFQCLLPGQPALTFADGKETGCRLPGNKREWEQPGTGRGGNNVWAFAFDCRFFLTRYFAGYTSA